MKCSSYQENETKHEDNSFYEYIFFFKKNWIDVCYYIKYIERMFNVNLNLKINIYLILKKTNFLSTKNSFWRNTVLFFHFFLHPFFYSLQIVIYSFYIKELSECSFIQQRAIWRHTMKHSKRVEHQSTKKKEVVRKWKNWNE